MLGSYIIKVQSAYESEFSEFLLRNYNQPKSSASPTPPPPVIVEEKIMEEAQADAGELIGSAFDNDKMGHADVDDVISCQA